MACSTSWCGTGGAWDFKQQGSQYEDYGNFHYGVVGSAEGSPPDVLSRAAGWAQTRSGNYDPSNGTPLGDPPYGDDPKDQDQIAKGIWRYEHCYGK
ncbi:polymorphic toxin type 44 domain-containing protein [Luteibacter rhizovicinus]|uniref:polymorphic toxin type 44 domain-containing protein n=1 Tax=Luteibacter rhizovicinus TaxID=242606 RepID=UPI001B80991A